MWSRERVRAYLQSEEAERDISHLLVDFLSKQRLFTFHEKSSQPGDARPGTWEIQEAGSAGIARIIMTAIQTPDETQDVQVFLSADLTVVSDLGTACLWVQQDTGHVFFAMQHLRVLTDLQAAPLACLGVDGHSGARIWGTIGARLERTIGEGGHGSTKVMPLQEAEMRLRRAPQVIAAVMLAAYETGWAVKAEEFSPTKHQRERQHVDHLALNIAAANAINHAPDALADYQANHPETNGGGQLIDLFPEGRRSR